jgi:hypothetical protein
MKYRFLILLAALLMMSAIPALADDRITYVSQPEAVTIFLNNIAFAHDTFSLAGGSDLDIVLPEQIYPDTLILYENGKRVPSYTLSRATGALTLRPEGSAASDLREITLEYLMYGLSWKPNYDMAIADTEDAVHFAFYAEISNSVFPLDAVDVTLAAGRVDIAQPVPSQQGQSANQYIAGYAAGGTPQASLAAGAVTIQYQYPLGKLSIAPGDTLYRQVLETDFDARRLLLWNANTDQQVSVIYKVNNDSEIALSEGIVRSYQDGLFIGSDSMEFTPVGSEGSITVGHVQDVRVNRAESSTYQDVTFSDRDYLHEITLTMSNFGADDIAIEVVDRYPADAVEFEFSAEPQRDAGNLLRWPVTIPAGETVTITYKYQGTS